MTITNRHSSNNASVCNAAALSMPAHTCNSACTVCICTLSRANLCSVSVPYAEPGISPFLPHLLQLVGQTHTNLQIWLLHWNKRESNDKYITRTVLLLHVVIQKDDLTAWEGLQLHYMCTYLLLPCHVQYQQFLREPVKKCVQYYNEFYRFNSTIWGPYTCACKQLLFYM